MKRLLWVSRGEKPIIEIVLDVDSAQWIADHLPQDDDARRELAVALYEQAAVSAGESHG